MRYSLGDSIVLGCLIIGTITLVLAPYRPAVALAASKNEQHAIQSQGVDIPSWEVVNGDQTAQQQQQRGVHRRRRQRIPILEYNNDWICVNKPPGLTVHRSNSTPKHKPVLVTSLKRQLGRKTFPVHRLDHRTSGAMLLAFDSYTAGTLHTAAIRHGRKQYLALVRGEWTYPNTTRIVDKPLVVQTNVTKEAQTRFTLLGTLSSLGTEVSSSHDATSPSQSYTMGRTNSDNNNDNNNDDDEDTVHPSRTPNLSCSLLLCEPLTGRTHQIRRHAYTMGHPILGDSQHGDTVVNRWWKKNKQWNRLALHCWKIEFTFDGTTHNCIAPVCAETFSRSYNPYHTCGSVLPQ
jgi:tRNA pseudouridine65 synthase